MAITNIKREEGINMGRVENTSIFADPEKSSKPILVTYSGNSREDPWGYGFEAVQKG